MNMAALTKFGVKILRINQCCDIENRHQGSGPQEHSSVVSKDLALGLESRDNSSKSRFWQPPSLK